MRRDPTCSFSLCRDRGYGALARCLRHARCEVARCREFGVVLVLGEPRCAAHRSIVAAIAPAPANVVVLDDVRRERAEAVR